jgi:hypothetical protein
MQHTDSQNKQILAALKKGDRLTSLCIILRFQCIKPSNRISELRAEGHPIADRWIKTPGTRKRVKEYFIAKN